MARKKKQEEHENHERWLVSYADFITLLFAFFVVMYSISSVNEGKYRVLSDTLNTAFKDSGKSLKPIQIGDTAKTLNPLNHGVVGTSAQDQSKAVINPAIKKPPTPVNREAARKKAAIRKLNNEVEASFSSFIEKDLMTLRKNKDSLEVELKSKILFASGGAKLTIPAEKILIKLAVILARFPSSTQVEGHTDDSPVSSVLFPSNWALSASRAAAVADLFAEHGIDPDSLKATGYAEFKPLVENTTSNQRKLNRRVVLLIKPADKNKKSSEPASLDSINTREQETPVTQPDQGAAQTNQLQHEDTGFNPIKLPPAITIPGENNQQSEAINLEPVQ